MNEIVTALAGLLSTILICLINRISNTFKDKVKNDTEEKYIKQLSDAIETCVISTNQTYVDALKANDKFGENEMKEAFKKSCEEVNEILSESAKKCLVEIYGDLNLYISDKVEAKVHDENKV